MVHHTMFSQKRKKSQMTDLLRVERRKFTYSGDDEMHNVGKVNRPRKSLLPILIWEALHIHRDDCRDRENIRVRKFG